MYFFALRMGESDKRNLREKFKIFTFKLQNIFHFQVNLVASKQVKLVKVEIERHSELKRNEMNLK